MSIRPFVPADAVPLGAALAQLPLMQRYARTADGMAADFRSAYERGEHLFVWDTGNGPQGVLWFFPAGTFGLGGYLRLIALAPGATGGGAGKKLLAEYEAQVTAVSRHAFLLVSDFNVDAQRFYEKNGYVKVGAVPKMVRPDIDELIYWKKLR